MKRIEKITDTPQIYKICIPLEKNALKNINIYIICSLEEILVIDTGFNTPECRCALLEGLKELGVDISRASLFITHSHADHLGLAGMFSGVNNKIIIGEEEYNYFCKVQDETYWSEQNNCYIEDGYPREALLCFHKVNSRKFPDSQKKFVPDCLLKDQEEFRIGSEIFRAVQVPGHTPGHMCLYMPKHNIMFLGDHVLYDISPNLMMWPFMPDSLESYLESLNKLTEYDVKLALPAHRGNGDISLKERIDQLKYHHKMRLNEIMNILQSSGTGGMTAYEIAARMSWSFRENNWDTAPEQQRWFAVGEARAHLTYLQNNHKVVRIKTDDMNRYYIPVHNHRLKCRNLLFEESSIGHNKVKNRIVRSATNDHLCNADGTISVEQVRLYEMLAKNNVGTIITGHFAVDEKYKTAMNQPLLSDDKYIKSAKKLSEAVHRYNGIIYGQISQGGINAYREIFDINTVSIEEIEKTIGQFSEASYRLKQAGYDGVQIHLAHRYFLANVLDNTRNQRTDQYGGNKENRFRLIRKIIMETRKKCGDHFSIIVKMNATNEKLSEYDAEFLYYAKELSALKIDAIELSGPDFKEHSRDKKAYYLRQAMLIKKHVDIPVILVGGLSERTTMEEVLSAGIDFVSCSRAFICNPEFVTDLMKGQTKSKCVGCWQCVKIYNTRYQNCIYLKENEKLRQLFYSV